MKIRQKKPKQVHENTPYTTRQKRPKQVKKGTKTQYGTQYFTV